MRKYTDEQLSRVLSEHAGGRMRRGGTLCEWDYREPRWGRDRCVAEVASRLETDDSMKRITNWFDNNYWPDWTADEFLAELEKQGLA